MAVDLKELLEARARRVAAALAKVDRLRAERAAVVASFDDRIAAAERELAEAAQDISSPVRDQIEAALEPRSRKPKKRWRQIADYISGHPTASYPELCEELYGSADAGKVITLRTMLHHMRQAGAVEGEPGAWRLLKAPEQIEWLVVEDDGEPSEEAARGAVPYGVTSGHNIRRFLLRRPMEWLKAREITERMNLPPNHIPAVRAALVRLVEAGLVQKNEHGAYRAISPASQMEGKP